MKFVLNFFKLSFEFCIALFEFDTSIESIDQVCNIIESTSNRIGFVMIPFHFFCFLFYIIYPCTQSGLNIFYILFYLFYFFVFCICSKEQVMSKQQKQEIDSSEDSDEGIIKLSDRSTRYKKRGNTKQNPKPKTKTKPKPKQKPKPKHKTKKKTESETETESEGDGLISSDEPSSEQYAPPGSQTIDTDDDIDLNIKTRTKSKKLKSLSHEEVEELVVQEPKHLLRNFFLFILFSFILIFFSIVFGVQG